MVLAAYYLQIAKNKMITMAEQIREGSQHYD